jgi:hypothetical protein
MGSARYVDADDWAGGQQACPPPVETASGSYVRTIVLSLPRS